jgi:hypothetical protein
MSWERLVALVLFLAVAAKTGPAKALQPEKDGDLSQVVLGISGVSLSDVPNLQKDKDIKPPTRKGVIITEVLECGPAAAAGLKELDIITKIDKTPVATAEDLAEVIAGLGPGQEVEISGFRTTSVADESSKVKRKFKGAPPPDQTQNNGGQKTKWVKGSVRVTAMTRRELLLNSFHAKVDEVLEATKYVHKNTGSLDGSPFYCYCVTKKGEPPALFVCVDYFAPEWVFMNHFIMKVDDQSFEFGPNNPGEVQRDTSGHGIHEWYDQRADDNIEAMLSAIASSGRVIFRMQGDKYKKDYELTAAERKQVAAVLQLHRVMSRGE